MPEYGAILEIRNSDSENGVTFGTLDNSLTGARDPEGHDKLPAQIVIPHIIWRENGFPPQIAVYFHFEPAKLDVPAKDYFYQRDD